MLSGLSTHSMILNFCITLNYARALIVHVTTNFPHFFDCSQPAYSQVNLMLCREQMAVYSFERLVHKVAEVFLFFLVFKSVKFAQTNWKFLKVFWDILILSCWFLSDEDELWQWWKLETFHFQMVKTWNIPLCLRYWDLVFHIASRIWHLK